MKLYRLITVALLFLPTSLLAAKLSNDIAGVGLNGNIKPYICIQNSNSQVTHAIAPGTSSHIELENAFGQYVGATIRFDGCSTSNTYLGYIGFILSENGSNKVGSYTPPAGIHIEYSNPKIDSNGKITGKINYTQIEPNFSLLEQPPQKNSTWQFVGANLSGLEFSRQIDPVVIPNLSLQDTNQKFSDLAEFKKFISAGMNTIRVPVRWGYLQLEKPGTQDNPINLEYYNNYVRPLLQSLTSAKVNTIVDLHAYMRYSIAGKEFAGCSGMGGNCPDGSMILDSKAYQEIWSKLYNLMKNDPQIDMDYILIDIVNEPVDVPDDKALTIQTAVIQTLREIGFTGYILVEGNSWSGLHSWDEHSWQSSYGQTTYTNARLFTRENFAKHGVTDLSKILINVHQYFDYNYSGTQNSCLTDLSTQGANAFNLNSFVDYLQTNQLKAIVTEFGVGTDPNSCANALNKFLTYLQDNAVNEKDYGFVGWTIWSAGHGWGGYNLRITPDDYRMQVLIPYLQ